MEPVVRSCTLGTTNSPTGEPLEFFVDEDDVVVRRADGTRHFYCPLWHWEMSLAFAEIERRKAA